MKKNVLIFILGFILGAGIVGVFLYLKTDPYSSYSYTDKELISKIKAELDKRGVLYEYKEDHLKRIWIKPLVNDATLMPALVSDLKVKG